MNIRSNNETGKLKALIVGRPDNPHWPMDDPEFLTWVKWPGNQGGTFPYNVPQDVIDDFLINNMSDFSVAEMMGDPADVYADGYAELNKFFTDIVNQYEIRLEPNKYIRAQKKIFNESLIDRIKRVLPSNIDTIEYDFNVNI